MEGLFIDVMVSCGTEKPASPADAKGEGPSFDLHTSLATQTSYHAA